MIVPRAAATLMLVRDGAEGLEVLMLRRNLSSQWAGGIHLFPGGAVDKGDSSRQIFARTLGRSDEEASRLLGVGRDGLAFFVAAIRECFEEAGILLARSKQGPPGSERRGRAGALAEGRRRLNAKEVDFATLVAQAELFLDAGRLCYFSHWVTPEGSARRYDTRFFVAPAPEGQQALHDDVEVIDSAWIRPSVALARHEAGEIDLWLPTVKNLEAIGRFEEAGALIEAAASRQVEVVLPKMVFAEQGVRILLPGEEGYDALPQAPGSPGFPGRSK